MISTPLLKRNLLTSVKLLAIFTAILTLYTTIIIYMYDPSLSDMLNQFQKAMPGMMAAVGMTGDSGSLIGFIHTYLYGFLMMLIPTVFSILLCNKMLMKYVDSGSMACLLATPNSRKKIIITQVISIIASIFILLFVVMIIGLISSVSMFPGELDMEKYIQLNFSAFFMHFAISGIMFFSACFFNTSQGYLAVGAGIPLFFYLIEMLSNMGGKLENLKYATIFTLFPGEEIVAASGGFLGKNLLMLGIGIVLYAGGVLYFIRKDLSL